MRPYLSFGVTFNGIIADGFEIEDPVKIMPASDEDRDIAEASGIRIARFSRCFYQLGLAAILIFDDRFEIFLRPVL